MRVDSAFSAGVQGFQQAQQLASNSANNIARQTSNVSDGAQELGATAAPYRSEESLNTQLVNLNVAEQQAKSSAKVISAADEMLGSIIDIKV
ncbi:flagellar biosynthesis protein FlgE [Motilimonas pumila]|uniref:Flagellar biosynthesis protein FlgE n=1 Tax=Motilimonas pumila TaxID=2303987 RepID=A0A418YKS4_9GAMM|nr:flagellar biosynthesis protein FlgE [Motilimonas pumila]RJG51581.1 flagellar biosynthesis protein FlgE [Motilimonas pumila]